MHWQTLIGRGPNNDSEEESHNLFSSLHSLISYVFNAFTTKPERQSKAKLSSLVGLEGSYESRSYESS